MPRPKAKNPRSVQVTYRLTVEEHEVLSAAAFVDPEAGTANDYAYRHLKALLPKLARDADIDAAVQAARSYRGKRQGNVEPLTRRRGT